MFATICANPSHATIHNTNVGLPAADKLGMAIPITTRPNTRPNSKVPPKNSVACSGRVATSFRIYVSAPSVVTINAVVVNTSANCNTPNCSGPNHRGNSSRIPSPITQLPISPIPNCSALRVATLMSASNPPDAPNGALPFVLSFSATGTGMTSDRGASANPEGRIPTRRNSLGPFAPAISGSARQGMYHDPCRFLGREPGLNEASWRRTT